jgi:hypothetical protein
MRRPWPTGGCCAKIKINKIKVLEFYNNVIMPMYAL